MKYYLPTTTLNFSNILSSESVSPSSRYSRRTLGFNHFELSFANPSSDHLFVCDRIPVWNIEESSNDDYPLVLEVDESTLPLADLKLVVSEPVRIWAFSTTVYISPQKTRFLFRSIEERRRMLLKLSAPIENKCESLYREANCFDLVSSDAICPINAAIHDDMTAWAAQHPYDHSEGIASDIAAERRCGAELGAAIGLWVRGGVWNMASSIYRPHTRCADRKLFPPDSDTRRARAYVILDAALEFIVGRGNLEWRWDKPSIVEFCASLWSSVLLPQLRMEAQNDAYRDSFNRLLRNLQTHIDPYSIQDEKSPFLQALATFLIGGRDSGKIARLITTEGIACPEIALSLYGAVVGYTRFPRTLMDGDTYRPPLPPENEIVASTSRPKPTKEYGRTKALDRRGATSNERKVPPTFPPAKGDESDFVRDFAQALDALKVNEPIRKKFASSIARKIQSGLMSLQKFREWFESIAPTKRKKLEHFLKIFPGGERSEATRLEAPLSGRQGHFQFTDQPQTSADGRQPSRLFIEDAACVADLRSQPKNLGKLNQSTRMALADSLVLFQKQYARGGYYAQKPTKYSRDDRSTIEHFVFCLFSTKTKDLNVSLTSDEKATLKLWLKERYGL